jgi:hypothetical protein
MAFSIRSPDVPGIDDALLSRQWAGAVNVATVPAVVAEILDRSLREKVVHCTTMDWQPGSEGL